MKSTWLWEPLVAALGSGVYAGNVLATPSSGLTTTSLAKSVFDQFKVNAHSIPADRSQAPIKTRGQSDVYVVDNKLASGGSTGWHSHPGPSLILVLAGTVTNYTGDDPTCRGHAYSAGTGFIDPGGNDVHMLRNEGSPQVETIAVQLLPKDAVRRIDEPAPGNCPLLSWRAANRPGFGMMVGWSTAMLVPCRKTLRRRFGSVVWSGCWRVSPGGRWRSFWVLVSVRCVVGRSAIDGVVGRRWRSASAAGMRSRRWCSLLPSSRCLSS